MAEEKKSEGGYTTGYGKPPKHTQWKKGQSGNPSGKKKKEESLRAKLRKVAMEEVVVKQNGVPVVMTKETAMLASVMMKAVKGDLAPAKFVAEILGVGSEVGALVVDYEVTNADLGPLQTQADWLGLIERCRADLAAASGEGVSGEIEDDGEDAEDL